MQHELRRRRSMKIANRHQLVPMLGLLAVTTTSIALAGCWDLDDAFDVNVSHHVRHVQGASVRADKHGDSARVVISGKPVVIKEGEVVKGDLVVIDGEARVDGEVKGDLVVVAGKLRVGPKARVRGDLVTVATETKTAPGARVDQSQVTVNWVGVGWIVGNVLFVFEYPFVVAGVAFVALLILLLLAYRYIIRPYDSDRFHLTVDHQPVKAGIIGFLVVGGLHIGIVAAFLSRYAIGLVPVLGLALLVLSTLGWILVAVHVGRMLARRRGWTVGPFWYGLAGVGIGVLVSFVPVAGTVAGALASWVGIGALLAPAKLSDLPEEPTAQVITSTDPLASTHPYGAGAAQPPTQPTHAPQGPPSGPPQHQPSGTTA